MNFNYFFNNDKSFSRIHEQTTQIINNNNNSSNGSSSTTVGIEDDEGGFASLPPLQPNNNINNSFSGRIPLNNLSSHHRRHSLAEPSSLSLDPSHISHSVLVTNRPTTALGAPIFNDGVSSSSCSEGSSSTAGSGGQLVVKCLPQRVKRIYL